MVINKKNTLYIYILLLGFIPSILIAQEAPIIETETNTEEILLDQYFPVEGLNQWQYEFDLKDLKEGTYNVIVQGKDAAGNLQIGEAVDFIIDPESDLPQVSVTYPPQHRAIRGNLHVLGSADDDDGVDYVEIKLGDGEYQRAEGQNYWSYTLNTESLEDGEYTIICRSTDINGLSGEEQSVSFYIDRDSAMISTESHRNGDFVSGKINISGTASDLNGLEYMNYSIDGGITYNLASLKGKIKEGEGKFSFPINTKEIEDGPLTVLMKCRDLQGSTGTSSLLLYIDNTPPVLDIIHPKEESPENGTFSIIGRASDELGIASLSYTLKGEEAVEIPLIPGNPFWSIDVDFREQKQLMLQFDLSDIAGNSINYNLKRELNPAADIPQLKVQESYNSESEMEDRKTISGWITESSQPKGIVYTIDNGEEIVLEEGRTFSIPLDPLSAGEHTLSINSIDSYDSAGEKQKHNIIIPSSKPQIEMRNYLGQFEEERPFIQGGEIILPELDKEKKDDALPGYTGITGQIVFGSGSGTASYTLPDGTNLPLKMKKGIDPGTYLFEISFPETMEAAYYPIQIEALDQFAGRADYLAALWVTGTELSKGKDGIYSLTPKDSEESKSFHFEKQIDFLYRGDSIKSLELTDTDDSFSASESDGIITIKSPKAAIAEKTTIKIITRDGKEFTYGPITLNSDYTAPILKIKKEGVPHYVRDQIELSGTVEDDLSIEKLEYSINGEDFKTLNNQAPVETAIEDEVAREEESEIVVENTITSNGFRDIDALISLKGIEDGVVHLRIRATDTASNSREQEILLIKDSQSVQIEQVLPAAQEAVNGLFSLMVNLKDEWSESYSGEFIIAGESRPINTKGRQLSIDVDLAPFDSVPEDMALIIRDSAGNESIFQPQILFNAEKDKPTVQIYSPIEDGLITSDSIFSGIVLDDDGVQKIEYRIDDGEYISLPGGNSFEIPISIESLSDNTHQLDVRAFDLAGVESDIVSVGFRVSLKVPQAEMLLPILGTTHNGKIEISGTASDGNGIAEIQLSFDNGNSYKKALGQEEWSYTIDSTVFVDGNYMMLIRVIDQYDVEEIYSGLLSIDNTAPMLDLSKPMDGTVVTDELLLQMRVNDELSVSEILYTLKSLDPTDEDLKLTTDNSSEEEKLEEEPKIQPTELKGELQGNEVILSSLDLSDLPAGRYNLSIFAYDDARNEVAQSRNIIIRNKSKKSIPNILFPFEGADISGPFTLEGRIEGDYIPETVTLMMGGINLDVLETDANGYFSRVMSSEELREGAVIFQAEIKLPDGSPIKGKEIKIKYNAEGPWVRIGSINTGTFVTDRPWIEGSAGYIIQDNAEEETGKKELKGLELVKLEYSLNNGKSFKTFKAREQWKFRLETGEIPDGPLGILVRAKFRNGEKAVCQVHIQVDETAPDLVILTPEDGIRLNNSVTVTGTAFDENGLSDVSVMLRKRSKSSHEIPTFIQGLYLDSHFLGATTFAFGVGLTFFDDNVRLQALYGKAPAGRFNGDVFGLKLLANVATLPYEYLFGPDFDFLSSSIAIGSAFEFFTMSESPREQSGLVLGALLIQLEIIKVEIESLKFFNAYSLYLENQTWFISSDVEGGLENRVALGLRINIF